MPFFNKRGGRGRGGKSLNNRNPNKPFSRNPNKPGGIRKTNNSFSSKPFRAPNDQQPFNKRSQRGSRRRNDGNRGGQNKNGGRMKSDNLDRELDNYWGKDHKDHLDTRAKILNDDLESYWEKKPSKPKAENETAQIHENKENQENNKTNEQPTKKAAVDIPL